MSVDAPHAPEATGGVEEVHVLWISEGMSCDGDTISVTAASQPAIEDVLLGAIPGLPKVNLHNKVLSPTLGGEEYIRPFRAAVDGTLGLPYVVVIEGSIPNENINGDGYWTSFGNDLLTGQPITINKWIDDLAPGAFAMIAVGTCATYGGIHAMAGNPTGCMGLADYLGWDYRSAAGLPIVNIPGCPVQPDNFMETLTWLLYQAAGLAPMIPLDEALRPQWLFGKTVHEGCDRAGYYEQGDFAQDYNSPKCQVKIGCTMPGFPDKFMPFMDAPPGGGVSTAVTGMYGPVIRRLRGITNKTMNKETKWRHNRDKLTTGYNPRWGN